MEKLLPKDESFVFVAYSYGALIALETIHVLESRGYSGTLVCIEGIALLAKRLVNSSGAESEQELQTDLLCQLLSFCIPHDQVADNMVSFFENIHFIKYFEIIFKNIKLI